jgi:hypothetical protein
MKKDLPFFWKKYNNLDLGGRDLFSFTYLYTAGAESQNLKKLDE